MLPCSDDVRHMTHESLAPFHRNLKRLPRKQRQYESVSKANGQLVKRNRPFSSGGTDLGISSPHTSTRNGNLITPYHCIGDVDQNWPYYSAILFLFVLSEPLSCPVAFVGYLSGSGISLRHRNVFCATRGVISYTLSYASLSRPTNSRF
ncbi:unnamed protein product [Protopolystoma xenopodis]|uniref:Uncharacterized protein n=1 Tax=Protopolystoma xenopodis TaxID=117903 RepID=A0A3S5B0D9_9PLAT|nr:unnamed protein product [Protopolystoma xenopodis]